MTSWQDSPEYEEPEAGPEFAVEEPAEAGQPRSRRERAQPNPALDPRLAQLERRSRPPSKTSDTSLLVIGLIAFVFGIFLHAVVFNQLINATGSDGDSVAAEPTAIPDDGGAAGALTPTVEPQPTATVLPDRTSCEEIRGTQYRSVTEREFFLENCTATPAPPTPTQASQPAPTPAP